MKKTLLTIMALTLQSGIAQVYFGTDHKYGFSMLGSYGVTYGWEDAQSSPGSTTYESKKFCFGGGYEGGIKGGYRFDSGLGVDLGFSYLMGSKNEIEYKSSTTPNKNSSSLKARFYRSRLGMEYRGDKKFSPVLRAGMIAGIGKVLTESHSTWTETKYTFNPNPPYNTTTYTVTHTSENMGEYRGGISLGFYSAMGVNMKLNDQLNITLCLDAVIQEYAPKQYKLTVSKDDGVDQLPKMTASEKETIFKKKHTSYSNPTPHSPDETSLISLPLSSFGPAISVTYVFGKKKEESKTVKE